jgi:potassium-dependent mechanosensitive channel
MQCLLHNAFRAGVLVALLLCPRGLVAQEVQGTKSPSAAAEQPPEVPELADLIPLATDLSERLANLENKVGDQRGLFRLEQRLQELGTRVDDDAKQFVQLKASTGQRAGRLPEIKAEIEAVSDELATIADAVTADVRTFGRLRKEWIAEQRQWDAWQAVLRRDEPIEEIATNVTRAREDIETALALLRQQLKRLLTVQQQAGTLQARVKKLTVDVQALLSLSRGGALVNASPPMFSTDYAAQLKAALGAGVRTGLVQISWPEEGFFAEQGWIMVLQGIVSLGLAFVFFRHRHQLERVEHWQFVARRPIAAGILVGMMSVVIFFQRPPAMLLLALSVLVGVAFVRLVGSLVNGGWPRRLVFGLLILLIMTNVCYVFGLPLAVFRLYLVVAALISLLCCLRWAGESRGLEEARLYAWALRSAAALFAAVLFAELRGEAKLAEFLFVSSVRTLAVVLAFALFRHLVHGGLEWAVQSSAARGVPMVRSNVKVVVQRLSLVSDLLIAVVVLGVLLMVWQVYEGPAEAITGLLSMRATIGSQQLTLGVVLLAIAALGVAYVVSWMLQTLLTEKLLVRRNLDVGVSISITRLLHYALVSLGYVVALVVLGVDLTKMTLLASALGVGIGFGLQTIVNNFVCGLILLLERPVRVGDTIEMGGEWVRIAKIGLRSTTVRTLDQADVIVPNTDLVTNQVTNWTLTDRHARTTIPVGVAYRSDVNLVMQTLKECALAHPEVLKTPQPEILFRSFGDSALNFELRAWVKDVDRRLQVASDLNQDIDRRFHEAGIEIPFPQRDVHVRSVEGRNDVGFTVTAPTV